MTNQSFNEASKSKGGFNRWSYNQICEIWENIEGGSGGTQVPSDWEATSGVAQIKNKPQIEGHDLVSGNNTAESLGLTTPEKTHTAITEAVEQLEELIDKKQDLLVSGENIQKLKVNGTVHDLNKAGTIEITGGGSGTTDYNDLSNIPKFEGKDWKGELTSTDLELVKTTQLETVKTVLTQSIASKQDGLVSGENIKTINGKSVLGSGDIDTQLEYGGEVVISAEQPNKDLYDVGTLWISVMGESLIPHILKEDKTWGLYSKPVQKETSLPSLTGVDDGALVIIVNDTLWHDDPVYRADKSDESNPKWVKLRNRTISYPTIIDKPQVEGVELVGNKTATDLGLAKKEHTHNIQDVLLLDATLNAKQDRLHGDGEYQNIKTVGGVNLLGQGDIPISGGGGGVDIGKHVIIQEEQPSVNHVLGTLWIPSNQTSASLTSYELKFVDSKTWGSSSAEIYHSNDLPDPSVHTLGAMVVVGEELKADSPVYIRDIVDNNPAWIRIDNIDTVDYNKGVINKPQLGGVVLEGDKSFEDLGLKIATSLDPEPASTDLIPYGLIKQLIKDEVNKLDGAYVKL